MTVEIDENSYIIKIYESILIGQAKQFPRGTWSANDSNHNFKKCFRYLVLQRLMISKDELLAKVDRPFLVKYRLGGAYNHVAGNSTYECIRIAFPEWGVKPWEMKMAPLNTWDESTIADAVRWLFNDKLKWNRDDIIRGFQASIFSDNYLTGMRRAFDELGLPQRLNRETSGAYEILCHSFPEYNFKIWEFENEMQSWQETDIIDFFRWYFQENLNWSVQDIIEHGSAKLLTNAGYRPVLRFCDGSFIKAVALCYPRADLSLLEKRVKQIGQYNHAAKLADGSIDQIKQMARSGISQSKIAEHFNVRQTHISRILSGKVRYITE